MQSHDGPNGRPVLDDEEIVARMRAGDETGLEALLRKFGPYVKGRLCKHFGHLGDEDDRDTALGAAALAMWNRAHRLNPRRSLFGFMLTTTHRKLLRIAKQRAARPEIAVEQIDQFSSPSSPPVPTEFSTCLGQAFEELSALEHEVMTLIAAYGRQLPRTQLGRLLGRTEGSVNTAMWNLKRKLRQFLDAYSLARGGEQR